MKYFFVVGEASGDLHASGVMKALSRRDPSAEFMYVGGPMMRAVGGTCILLSERMAFMGFWDVVKNLKVIRQAASTVQEALLAFRPDAVICVDYAGFNFKYVLPFIKNHLPSSKVVYYIPPKVWAWKKRRVQTLKSHVDEVLCIFPFETDFFAQEGLSTAYYVGNPSLDTIKSFEQAQGTDIHTSKPYIALVPGSRISEIRKNLPTMLEVVAHFPEYPYWVTGAPGVDESVYHSIKGLDPSRIRYGETHQVIQGARVALVTSGTATLETALLGTPQVVCYAVGGGRLANFVFRHFFSIPYISLVNIISGAEVVRECYGAEFNSSCITPHVHRLLTDRSAIGTMRQKYLEVRECLDTPRPACEIAAEHIFRCASSRAK